MFAIFIAGASASGKTKLSSLLLDRLKANGGNHVLLKMDDYFHEIPDGVDIDWFRKNTNFDKQDMLKLDLLKEHLLALNRGDAIIKPIFDFNKNKCLSSEEIDPPDVIIVEGLFALHFAKKFLEAELSALTVFVETNSYLTLIKRRIERDMRERGRHDDSEVKQQERRFVGPAFFGGTTFVGGIASSKLGADIVIDNSEDNSVAGSHPLVKGAEQIIGELETKKALQDMLSINL